MRALLLVGLVVFLALIGGAAEAQRWLAPSGYGYWGSYRYWGFYGRPGGYYNGGDYRWNGFRPWVYRPRYY